MYVKKPGCNLRKRDLIIRIIDKLLKSAKKKKSKTLYLQYSVKLYLPYIYLTNGSDSITVYQDLPFYCSVYNINYDALSSLDPNYFEPLKKEEILKLIELFGVILDESKTDLKKEEILYKATEFWINCKYDMNTHIYFGDVKYIKIPNIINKLMIE